MRYVITYMDADAYGNLVGLERNDVITDDASTGRIITRTTTNADNPAVRVEWFIGSKAPQTTTLKESTLLNRLTDLSVDWGLVATQDDRTHRTRNLLEAFCSQIPVGSSFTRGDRVQLPDEDEYTRRVIAHEWCGATGRLTETGASIATYYSLLADEYGLSGVELALNRGGVPQFIRFATELHNPLEYEHLIRDLDDIDVDDDRYDVKTYPSTEFYINLRKGDEDVAATLYEELRTRGYAVNYRKDKRFDDGRNPRRLTVFLS